MKKDVSGFLVSEWHEKRTDVTIMERKGISERVKPSDTLLWSQKLVAVHYWQWWEVTE